MRCAFFFICLVSCASGLSQIDAYSIHKQAAIRQGSVFTKIINRELPADIVYEDAEIIAFVPLTKQAPVHFLIVPKKEIYTVNDINEEDTWLMGQLFVVAKKLAKQYAIDETGYRISINTNEDAGQSVFHLHMHLMGGEELGSMVKQ